MRAGISAIKTNFQKRSSALSNTFYGVRNLLRSGRCRVLFARFRRMAAVMFVMRRMRNLADIYHRKQREYERLNKCDEYRHYEQQSRNNDLRERRKKIRDVQIDLFVREHIREQAYAERQRPDHIADEFDTEDQYCNWYQHQRQTRAGEMAQMF